MTIRLTLVCVRSTSAVFGRTPLSERELCGAGTALASLPPYSTAVRSPSAESALIAAVLGLRAAVEPALRDIDHGAWHGRTVADVVAADPYGYSAWLTDPDAVPHGGESVRRLCDRVAHWLGGLPADPGGTLAIVEPAVAQAVLVHALSAPVRAFRNLPVQPRHTVHLTCCDGVWSVQPADVSPARNHHRPLSVPVTLLTAPWRPADDHGIYV
ncbi:histidine phosphatase family protein [Streptomyces sp. NPDC017936]|uniref:histidine phosphatase family protein n=1 Tax=Streptomyces sp. NPDC017936 TaxID=3365016 RepID=UPI00378CD23B